MTLPRVADSLAGRIETHTLLPLAGCEISGSPGKWLDALFTRVMPRLSAGKEAVEVGPAMVDRVLCGGYPQALARTATRRREAWLTQYVDMLIQRDVREIAAVEKLDQMPRLLKALAHMSGQLCNFAQLAGQIGLDNKTAERYLGVLEQMFLLRRVQQWSGNGLSRLVKSPKIQFIDSGLLSGLLGVNEELLVQQRRHLGAVLESYVYGELLKLASWAANDYEVLTFRTAAKAEVDFVLENRRGELIGVEVKASASFSAADFSGLRKLAELAGEKFRAGVLLYDGTDTLPMGEVAGKPLWAVPLSTLWMT
jgi:predicted AAA+ superfamily ATPase